MKKFDVVVSSRAYGVGGNYSATDALKYSLAQHGLSPAISGMDDLPDGTFIGFLLGEDAEMVKRDVMNYCGEALRDSGLSGEVFVFISENLEVAFQRFSNKGL